MRLFTVGPAMMFPEVLEASGGQLPYFRTEEFSAMMKDSESMLKRLLGAPPGSRAAFLTASGTGAMEAAVAGLFSSSDRLLVISGGGFGRRFGEICDVHGIPHDDVVLLFGKALEASDLEPFRGGGYAGMLANMDETSTGQLYDVRMLSGFCRSEGMLLVVDAISSFLADPLDMEADGIGAAIVSSQKALALPPGISMVVLSREAYEERLLKNASGLYYLDLKRHIEDQARGQTPFTPAVGTLIELNAALRAIVRDGAGASVERSARLARYFRKRAAEKGFRIPAYPLSNAVTPIILKSGAYDAFLRLKDERGLVVTPSGGDLRDRMLRIGHIGDLSEDDYDILLEAMEETIGPEKRRGPSGRGA